MVDTGAALNIVKRRNLNPATRIDDEDTLLLSGISEERIRTLGSALIKFMGQEIVLHLVGDEFPISQEGILGWDFLRDASQINFQDQSIAWQGVTIPFACRETITIPARTRAVLPLRVRNRAVPEGYIPRIPTEEGIYVGEALVTNRGGTAYVGIINTREEPYEIAIPTVELQEFDAEPAWERRHKPRDHANRGCQAPNPTVPCNKRENTDAETLDNKAGEPTVSCNKKENADAKTLGNKKGKQNPTVRPNKRENAEGETQGSKKGKSNPTVPSSKGRNADTRILAVKTEDPSENSEHVQAVKETLRLEHLNSEEKEHVLSLAHKYADIFRLPQDQLVGTTATAHRIITTDALPVHTKQYRFPPIHKEEINKQVQDLLDNNIIQPSSSPYNSPLWVVPKKEDSKGNKRWRMVIDYRALNEKTIGDAYPLPNITEILDQLGSAKYFSIFDLASGFHQIPMHEADAQKTAFSTPHGHYEFKRMPFGLKNAPATFQRLMDRVLTGLQGSELFVYLDDIVIYASSMLEHETKFRKLAERLRNARLQLQPDKCEFLRKEVTYLGHVIGENGVKPDPKKLEAVQSFPKPASGKNIKQFLGLAGYYRRFIPNFSKIAKPLTELLKKDVAFRWETAQDEAFTYLRDALCREPILQYPDFTKTFIVTTDASDTAIGGVLSQGTAGKDMPISYVSRLLNPAEQNYSTIEKELLAIVYCVQQFRPYLYGRQFDLFTDHRPLVWLNSVKDPTSRLVRWRLKLMEYDYKVTYKPGKVNANADALSRNPIQLLPLNGESDSDESIFSTQPPQIPSGQTSAGGAPVETADRPTTLDEPEIPCGHETNADDDRDNNEQEQIYITETEESGSDTDSDASSSDHELMDNVNEPYVWGRSNVHEIRNKFSKQKDNLVIFVSKSGDPCDKGSRMLSEENRLPEMIDGTLGRARVAPLETKYKLISLVVQERASIAIEEDIIQEAIRSLWDVCTEMDLDTISICRGDVGATPWHTIRRLLAKIFRGTPTRIRACTNEVITPPPEDRIRILREYHGSAIGGHKGVHKTYWRLKERYHWNNMKKDTEQFVRECRDCQLKKLVRQKTRQPMIITDTPRTAFDKISMDIMGPLQPTSTGHSYILTVQDLLTKYSLAIPLKQAAALNVADALVNEVICTFGAPKAILTDQGTHFINALFKAIARKFRIALFKTTAYRPHPKLISL